MNRGTHRRTRKGTVMKQKIKRAIGVLAMGAVWAVWALALFLAYRAAERAGIIRPMVYPDPVCEMCGRVLDGRDTVCTPEE